MAVLQLVLFQLALEEEEVVLRHAGIVVTDTQSPGPPNTGYQLGKVDIAMYDPVGDNLGFDA